jgi:hypothetical protein
MSATAAAAGLAGGSMLLVHRLHLPFSTHLSMSELVHERRSIRVRLIVAATDNEGNHVRPCVH